MRKSFFGLIVTASIGAAMVGCQSPPRTEAGREKLAENTDSVLAKMNSTDPTFQAFLDKSYGYAVFPTVGKGGLLVGGAYGHGEVFENGTKVGYAEITQVTAGALAGGQEYAEVLVFQDQRSLAKFKTGNFTFAAQASAVALKSGSSANAKYSDGVAIFTRTGAGLMAEAAIGGQKFAYQSLVGTPSPRPRD